MLITGVTRPLGRMLAHELYYDDRIAYVLGISRDERPYYFNDFDEERFGYWSVNILKEREVTNLYQSEFYRRAAVDTAIHLAFRTQAHVDHDGSSRLNVWGTRVVLDRCLEAGVEKFVFLSDAIVYRISGNTNVFLREDDELNLDSGAHPLVRAIVDADLLCSTRMDHPRCEVVILRPSGIIGRNIRSDLNSLFESAMVFKPMGYDPMVNPVHARDVIRALKLAILVPGKGVFNIGGKDIAPLSEFLAMNSSPFVSLPSATLGPLYAAMRRFGLSEFDYTVNPRRLHYNLVLDHTRAGEVLGYEPREHIKFR